ncbi:hypothetical protein B0A50_08437 [Salinomyces thailandicus]|uniref:Uncharacterized protein n=1 Tax=Salinomyces thailandicus TaxID=706561 RepID=A0A4U0TJN6_9PEZI|nr:hypothetical protein B0A50_08437 [Salinomyces thailandica]
MAEDWQETAFNNKRLPHSHGKKNSSKGKSKTQGEDIFNPNAALGSYELSGNALDRLGGKVILEIHELSEAPGGLVGSMVLAERLKAAVLLAGSRKQLAGVIEDAEAESEDSDDDASNSDQDKDEDDVEGQDSNQEEVVEEEEEDSEPALLKQDRLHNNRIAAFQKSAFGNPKFFLAWQGEVTLAPNQIQWEKNRGYLVFANNACKDLEGTLSCAAVGWKDVAIKGRKTTSKARPPAFSWAEMADGESGEEGVE